MTEDDKVIADALWWVREASDNKTEQAEWLDKAIHEHAHLRAAVARQLVARQVPLKGTVG